MISTAFNQSKVNLGSGQFIAEDHAQIVYCSSRAFTHTYRYELRNGINIYSSETNADFRGDNIKFWKNIEC